MEKLLSRVFPSPDLPDAPPAGVYQRILEDGSEQPDRLHLRIEPDGSGILIVNAANVLHINQTAAEHIYWWVKGTDSGAAAEIIAARYRVSKQQAKRDHDELREQILALATTPDLDPVVFLDMERTAPYEKELTAPYRLDCALTYKMDEQGTYDSTARARVDRELSVSEWKEVLTKTWQAGIPHVTFTGGEPTLFKGLPALIEHAESLGQITGLLTNGTKLTDAKFLHELVMTGVDHMLIAVNFSVPESVEGLQAALATDVFTVAHFTLNSKNATEAYGRIDDLKAMGVPAISLSAGNEDAEIEELLMQTRDHVAHLGMDLVWDLPAPYSRRNPIDLELDSPPQGAGRAWLYVEPDGDVLPGQGINKILGNILRDDWAQIWGQAKSYSV